MTPPSPTLPGARRGLLLHDASALCLSRRSAPGGTGVRQGIQGAYGRDPNFHGEVGYTAAQLVLLALERAGKDLTVDSFIKAMESIHDYNDIFGSAAELRPDQHHGSTKSFLTVVHNGRWVPVEQQALAY